MAHQMSKNILRWFYFSENSHLKRRLIEGDKIEKKKFYKKVRQGSGDFLTLEAVKKDPKAFQEYFHMTPGTFKYILNLIEEPLSDKRERFKKDISSETKLMVTLRFLITGVSYEVLAETFCLGVSSISVIVRVVCETLYTRLSLHHLPELTKSTFLSVCESFRLSCDFPNCLGSVDAKHIRLKTPVVLRSNEPRVTGLVLHIIVDANYRVVMFDTLVATEDYVPIFKDGLIYKRIAYNQLDLPRDTKGDFEELPCEEGFYVSGLPFSFVGNDSSPLLHRLLKPFPRSVDSGKKLFNEKITQAKECVDVTFDLLTYRWGVLTKVIETTSENALWIVKACVILHNVINDLEGVSLEKINFIQSNRSQLHLNLNDGLHVHKTNNNFSHRARRVREIYVDYFIYCS